MVNRGMPSSSGECVERGSDGRGHRIVEQNEGMRCGVIGEGDGIVSRRIAFVIAIDEAELPAGSIACERLDACRTRFADERHAVGDSRKTQRRVDAFVEIGSGEDRIDDVEPDACEREMARRPAEPASDLECGSIAKLAGGVVENGRFVAIAKPDVRKAPIDVPGVRDILAKIRPCVGSRIAFHQVWERGIGPNDF